MPYSPDDPNLPDYVKSLPAKRKRQWTDIWNSSYSRCMKGKSGDDAAKTCETSAFKQANGVVKVGSSNNSATFSAEPVATFELPNAPGPVFDDGETVYRGGLLFRSGSYPDKAYEMTPEELKAAVEEFAGPVPLDLEHVPSVLDGKIGELVSVECSDDGEELHGIVALPKWLDSVLEERKVSATWDRATKRLAGLALVRNPRVSDAALMAAFNEAAEFAQWSTSFINDLPDSSFLYIEDGGKKDGEGKTTPRSLRHFPYKDADGKIDLPHLRNAIARIPQSDVPNKDALQKKAQGMLERANNSADVPATRHDAEMANFPYKGLEEVFAAARHDTPEGQMVMQELHNAAARGGAVCKSSNAKMASSHESSAIQKIHDMTTDHGAKCSTVKGNGAFPFFTFGSRKPAKGDQRMSRMDEFVAWLKGDSEDGGPPAAQADTGATVVRQAAAPVEMSDSERAEFNALRQRAIAQDEEIRRIRLEGFHREAVMFADAALHERKIFPAQYDLVVSGYVQAAADGLLLSDPVKFNITTAAGPVEQTGTRLEQFKALIGANPGHQLTVEQLKPEVVALLGNQVQTEEDKAAMSDQRRQALKKMLDPKWATEVKNGAAH